MNNILVLCIGNICRSPMAEALIKHALPSRTVRSAGIGALIGKPADPFSIQIMEEQGISITPHRAQQLSGNLVAQADLILVMDRDQKKYIEQHYPNARGKVFRLCESENLDVPDPYKQGISSFQNAYRMISSGVEFWLKQIEKIESGTRSA